MVRCSPSSFLALGLRLLYKKSTTTTTTITTTNTQIRWFRSTFGASSDVCSHTWEILSHYKKKPERALPKHLLWAMLFLKSYGSEACLAGLFGVAEKTYRKWIWLMLSAISSIYSKVVSQLLKDSSILLIYLPFVDCLGKEIAS
jgi:hypothetical protein